MFSLPGALLLALPLYVYLSLSVSLCPLFAHLLNVVSYTYDGLLLSSI